MSLLLAYIIPLKKLYDRYFWQAQLFHDSLTNASPAILSEKVSIFHLLQPHRRPAFHLLFNFQQCLFTLPVDLRLWGQLPLHLKTKCLHDISLPLHSNAAFQLFQQLPLVPCFRKKRCTCSACHLSYIVRFVQLLFCCAPLPPSHCIASASSAKRFAHYENRFYTLPLSGWASVRPYGFNCDMFAPFLDALTISPLRVFVKRFSQLFFKDLCKPFGLLPFPNLRLHYIPSPPACQWKNM